MKHPIVTPVKCDNCHRMTQTYNVSLATGDTLCPVCITELSQHEQVKPGPSEVKESFGPVVSWDHNCIASHRGQGCGSCYACHVER